MIECHKQSREEVLTKLDGMWDGNVDYIEQLFGMIEEADVLKPSWHGLVSEVENALFYYDEWSKCR
jgi:hypothetical protein